jgi:hypothetical protein
LRATDAISPRVYRVRRQTASRAELDAFASSAERVDDFPDERSADTKPREYLSILLQNFVADWPDECPLFYPALHELRTCNVALVDRIFHSSDADD